MGFSTMAEPCIFWSSAATHCARSAVHLSLITWFHTALANSVASDGIIVSAAPNFPRTMFHIDCTDGKVPFGICATPPQTGHREKQPIVVMPPPTILAFVAKIVPHCMQTAGRLVITTICYHNSVDRFNYINTLNLYTL